MNASFVDKKLREANPLQRFPSYVEMYNEDSLANSDNLKITTARHESQRSTEYQTTSY